MKVWVRIDPKFRDFAIANGYDTEDFIGELLTMNDPWMFWSRVLPLSGRHCRVVELPPMFLIKEIP